MNETKYLISIWNHCLKPNKLDPNKIEGYWALHSNSKYPHIHLGFFEKETNHSNNYRQSGKFRL
ncbi:hypothetical protein HYE36_06500 [Mycoplasmopsis bovis]|nr:hypothetical protein [Mycoplasmopsis bovis]WHL49714.1 hypothetical protein HYE36_06500 [Mycoplasmopsis bovis]